MKFHESVTADRAVDLAEADEYLGICIECGAEAEGVEPDAERYSCEACGARAVFGAEQLVIMLVA
jgi:DNA-directed RNA polymerase subunit RPC12/RpoP